MNAHLAFNSQNYVYNRIQGFLVGVHEFELGHENTTHRASWGSLMKKPKDFMQCTKRQAHEETTQRTKRQALMKNDSEDKKDKLG
jgi:hypothetical protein